MSKTAKKAAPVAAKKWTARTWNAKKGVVEDENKVIVHRKWWVVDAKGQTLGRLATQLATLLRGKHKPTFTPNVDVGDFVIVINSDHVNMTGKKWQEKLYYRHSRYFGGIKSLTASEQREKDSTFIIKESVEGMLPNNKLARSLIAKLNVYAGPEHPHAQQKPEAYTLATRK
jgi:large subunit ribosomal protein L13